MLICFLLIPVGLSRWSNADEWGFWVFLPPIVLGIGLGGFTELLIWGLFPESNMLKQHLTTQTNHLTKLENLLVEAEVPQGNREGVEVSGEVQEFTHPHSYRVPGQ